ncbi:MAG: hypothetical protein GF331_05465 [Chitinivibrionales bacterium]|nr:hypothetical protein [Chitinivibrionales bacterium]
MANGRIRPSDTHPMYWQYKGKDTLLLGGSVEDNLFQMRDLEKHLDLLKSVGGNFLRCTMSSRDEGDVWPYAKDPDTGLYDLETWDEEYWLRLKRFLDQTTARDIVVQVEIWATWDFYRLAEAWERNAYNPKNNSTYTARESGLPETWDYLAPERINPFFETVPELANNERVLNIQKRFVDRLLATTLDYDHVLYCMNNETNADPRWGVYWNRHIKAAAATRGVRVETTDMFDYWDPSDGRVPGVLVQSEDDHPFVHRSNAQFVVGHPEEYSFVDISNHNAQHGQVHYETGLFVRNQVKSSGIPRPVGCDKMYGGDLKANWAGTRQDGQERFWRNVFAGLAACRFHRPDTGLGLNELAQAHLKSMRMLTDELDVCTCEPHNDLLVDRVDNGSYCLAHPGRAYAVVAFGGASSSLDCSALSGSVSVRWLDILESAWQDAVVAQASGSLVLQPADDRYWVALVTAA